MNNMKKLLALLLAIVMVVGMVPFGAMAEETELCECTLALGHEGECYYRHLDTCAGKDCTGMLDEETACECDCHFKHADGCSDDCEGVECDCECHLHSDECVENCEGETKLGEECDCACHKPVVLSLPMQDVQENVTEAAPAQCEVCQSTEHATADHPADPVKCDICQGEHKTEECKVCLICKADRCTCVVCEECGMANDHTSVCSLRPCEDCGKVPCECVQVCAVCSKEPCECPKVGDKLWIKPSTEVYKQAGGEKGYSVKLPYHIVIKEVQTVDGAVWYHYDFADISAISGAIFLKDYKWVPAANTAASEDIAIPEDMKEAATEASEALEDLEEGLKDVVETIQHTLEEELAGTKVKIEGIMPEDIQLMLEEVKIPEKLKEMTSIEDDHIAFSFDITLAQPTEERSFFDLLGGSAMEEWQPEEGKPVTVTVEVKGCENGNILAVYHEDGETGEVELVGLYPVEDGKISFEAKSFSGYTALITHLEFFADPRNNPNYKKFTIPAANTITVDEVMDSLSLPHHEDVTQTNYPTRLSVVHKNINADDFGGTVEDFPVVVDNDVIDFTKNPAVIRISDRLLEQLAVSNQFAVVNLPFNNSVVLFFIRTNLSGSFTKPADADCFLYEDYNGEGRFYFYDEATDTKIAAVDTNITSLKQMATYGWTNNMPNVKILMNRTYQAGYDLAKYGHLEDLNPLTGQTLLLERYSGFKDPLIQVNYNKGSTFDVGVNVTIDNKSGTEKNLTAIKVVKSTGADGASYGGLMIFRGTLKDSSAAEANEFRGIGIELVADAAGTVRPTDTVKRGDGGILELDDGCTIENFNIAVRQFHGTTALTYKYPGTENTAESHKADIHLTNNKHSIVLYHHNLIEKWGTFRLGMPEFTIYLEEIDQWDSGDLVLGSGYEWRYNPDGIKGSAYPQDGSNGWDHYWTPVIAADRSVITFENGGSLSYTLDLQYYDPHNYIVSTGYTPSDTEYAKFFKNWNAPQFIDPYPVIRFVKDAVYNVNRNTWHYTLGEAVAASQPGDELVFYDNTSETGTVYINHDLTIRSSYKGELSKANPDSNDWIADDRGGGDFTATWSKTDNGNCLNVARDVTVNLVGEYNADKDYGTLTFDADGKGRVMAMYHGSVVNMEDGITLTKGDAQGFGGGVMNVGGTFNMTGGTISNNTVTTWNGANNGGAFVNQSADGYPATINISGGTITGNSANTGGAIGNAGTVYITGGSITENNATTDGGAVNNAGVLYISGGSITNNAAVRNGDGIYQVGTFNLSGNPVFSGHAQEDVYLPAITTTDTASGFYVITKAGELTYSNKIKVTLGNGENNLYDGRNVVESGDATIASTDINKFNVTNELVENNPTKTTSDKYAFRYEANDATPGKSGHVLELDVRGDLKIEKILTYQDQSEQAYTGAFTFTVTLPEDATVTGGYDYKVYNSDQTEASAGKISNGGTISLRAGQYAIIEDVELGAYSVVEGALKSDFGTPDWSGTDEGNIIGRTTVTATCTNTKLAKTAKLTLTKDVVKRYKNDTMPTGQYKFTVNFGGRDISTDKKATYQINGGTKVELSDNGTVQLSDGDVAVFDMPIGEYIITEETLANEDFETPVWTVNGTKQSAASYSASGDLTANAEHELTCTNYYKKQVGDLVITKKLSAVAPDEPAFVFRVTGSGVDVRVTINMQGKTENSVTIKDLPFGNYTVTEDTGWSAKYTVSDGNTRTATVSATDNGAVSFTNTRGTKWLTWDTNISNHFAKLN